MKKFVVIVSSLMVVAAIGITGLGIASAATPNADVGTSGIPRRVFQEERLQAAATVLNTSTANVQAAHKNKAVKQLISSAGLTKQTYAEMLKAQLTKNLESKGYSQGQATIAMQHRQLVRLHHKSHS